MTEIDSGATPQRENGHIDIANTLADHFMKIRISGKEWQVLWVILRETYGRVDYKDGKLYKDKGGWVKKKIAPISFTQLANLTGIKRRNIWKIVQKLIQRNLVIKKGDDTVSKKGDYTICKYGLQKDWRKWTSSPIRVTVIKKDDRGVIKKDDRGVIKKDDRGVIKKDDSKIGLKSIPERDSDAPKETSKETSKETTTVQKQKINFDFNKEKWENIKNKDKEGWLEAYPSCDINTELAQMREWLISNPNKKKKNYRRFIINWLSRSQERGGTKKPYQSEEAREQAFREQKIKENKRQKEEERIRQQKIIDEVEIRLRDLDPEKRKELEVKAKGEFKKTAGVIRPEREKAFIDGWIKNWVEVGIRAKFSIEETKSRAPP